MLENGQSFTGTFKWRLKPKFSLYDFLIYLKFDLVELCYFCVLYSSYYDCFSSSIACSAVFCLCRKPRVLHVGVMLDSGMMVDSVLVGVSGRWRTNCREDSKDARKP